ncbi:MAG: hypothetical protein R3Y27_08770, partial [Clostridia bacterium]
GAVSAAAGALRFFACPKKVTKKMAFSFFLEKKKNKKSIQGGILENPLALRWLSLGLVLDFWVCCFSFCFLVLCYRFGFDILVDFSAVLAFVDVVSHVSAAAGALRFFACPKKVTKKMAFSFFSGKKKNKKSIQGSILENPL